MARATASVKTAKLQPEGIEPYAFFAGGGAAVIDETAVIGAWNQPCEGVQFDQEVHDMFYDDYADWAHDYNDPNRLALAAASRSSMCVTTAETGWRRQS